MVTPPRKKRLSLLVVEGGSAEKAATCGLNRQTYCFVSDGA